jgi:hypothetical protein
VAEIRHLGPTGSRRRGTLHACRVPSGTSLSCVRW